MSDSTPPAPLTNNIQRDLIQSEIDHLQTLYLDARQSVQSVFNFYLNFVTAVMGGVFFGLQNIDGSVQTTLRTLFVVIFALALTMLNIYARLVEHRFDRLTVRIDMTDEATLCVARQQHA